MSIKQAFKTMKRHAKRRNISVEELHRDLLGLNGKSDLNNYSLDLLCAHEKIMQHNGFVWSGSNGVGWVMPFDKLAG